MSWKSVEMQVALPRTQDAGKIQEQLNRRGEHAQNSLTKQQVVEDDSKRKRVNDYNQKDNVYNKKKDGIQIEPSAKGRDQQNQDNEIEHPYLGHQIDFNG